MAVQEALVEETDACGDLGLRHSAREQVLRERDAAMGHVGVRRQAHLIAKRTAQAKLVEPRVRGQGIQVDSFGEALVEQRLRPRDRRAGARVSPGLHAARRTHHVDQGVQRIARGFFERLDRRLVEQATVQRQERLRAWVAWVERVRARPDDAAFECGARFVEQRFVEHDDLKVEPATPRAFDHCLAGNLHADASRCARPLRAAAGPLRLAGEVGRRAVAIGHGPHERPLPGKTKDGHARKRTPQHDRGVIFAFERSGHASECNHPVAIREDCANFVQSSEQAEPYGGPMRIFLTGATGFIGSHVLPELLEAGHRVLGLCRSDAGAKQLAAAGAEAYRGDLEDPATLRAGAEQADAVIHCAFDHDFSRFVESCHKDERNIEAMAEALAGSTRPLIISSGCGMGSRAPGELATEDFFDAANENPRKISEQTGDAVAAARGVNVSYVRLPQVHDRRKQGLITPLIGIARAKGRVAYVGAGKGRWAAAHVSDVARVFALAVERAEPGARYHAVAEEGVSMRAVAEALGRSLSLPVVSLSGDAVAEHFGFMARFADLDISASSALTQAKLGWKPVGPGLIDDLEHLEL